MDAYLLPSSTLILTMYGYIFPLLAVLIIISNTLACIVLMKKHMRNPTNVLLMAMAISDMLTGASPIPCFLYFYTLGHYQEYVPADWCRIYHVMTIYMPTIFHTASKWITVTLAIQRYVCVCHPLLAKQLCTIPNVLKCIFGIYFMAVLFQLGFIMEYEYFEIEVPSRLDLAKNVSGCSIGLIPFIADHANAYYNILYWFRIVFAILLPCLVLVIMNAILVKTMYVASKRRQLLLKQQRETESQNLQESVRTTLMLVAVVGLYLLVEIPSGFVVCISVIQITFSLNLITHNKQIITTIFMNFFILLSYPLNLVIYCGMSKQFRETFKLIFTKGFS